MIRHDGNDRNLMMKILRMPGRPMQSSTSLLSLMTKSSSSCSAIATSSSSSSGEDCYTDNNKEMMKIQTNTGAIPSSRRGFVVSNIATFLGMTLATEGGDTTAHAADATQVTEEELNELYDNPNIPKAPEEKSGLVVLRVAEVAQFQEKILRSVANGELEGVKVSPMQFVFGTQILLKNSNLDSNMKLMIYNEIPKSKRDLAIKNSVNSMNILQDIIVYANNIKRDFEIDEMYELANMYLKLRINLNELYEYLPQKEKDKYYGYFVKVTEYEKKIAEGVYNPDIDGVLKFD